MSDSECPLTFQLWALATGEPEVNHTISLKIRMGQYLNLLLVHYTHKWQVPQSTCTY